MLLRPANTSDIPQILANGKTFATSAYPGIPFDEETFFGCVMQMMNDGLLIVAEENGEHFGGVGAIKGPLFINTSVSIAMERFWWVKPEHRASGIGRDLLKALEAAAKEQGCARVLMIALHNDELPFVDGFYKKFGYAPMEHFYAKVL